MSASFPQRFARALAVFALSPAAIAAAPTAPPAASVNNVAETYQGVTVDDPYRHLEKLDSAEVQEWAKGQGGYARARLDSLPGHAALRERIDALDAKSSDRVFMIRRVGASVFFLKRQPHETTPKLYKRIGKMADQLVFDTEGLKASTGKTHSINSYSVSPDGRYVALVLSAEDAELGAIHVMETDTGKMVGATVPRIWGELPAIWLPDSRSFVYERSSDPAKAYGKEQLIIRRVGSDGKDDLPLLGHQIDGPFKSRENDWLFVSISETSPHVLLTARDGVGGLLRAYVQPRNQFGKPGVPWREVFAESHKVRGYAHSGKWLYGRTFEGASRYRILRWDLSRPDAAPVEVVAQQAGVIEELDAASDGLFYVVRNGAVSELFALPHGAGKARKVSMPVQGSIYLQNTEHGLPGAVFSLEPWTAPPSLMWTRVANPKPVDLGLIGNKGEPFKDVIALEATCPARDGVKVPISILMKKGTKLDAGNPTILNGYGGYGMTTTAAFSPTWYAWLERGGIVAMANPRGSGAYGEDWYQAGRGPTKPNTWRDMIDCAEMLIKERYTSSAKLAIRGVSMGGVAAGRALTERPDLFSTAILQVGMLDAVRNIVASQNGPNHLLEMGDVKTEAGIKQLLAMSSYHNVKNDTAYPAVFVSTGLHDNRVEPWMSFKMAARLQQASSSGKPILLRIDEQGGHGVSTTSTQRNALLADYLSFHLWQAGDPQFQPK